MSRQPLRQRLAAPFAPGLLALALAGAWGGAQAQSLRALYDTARSYDAPYQSARLAADAAVFKAEQSLATKRPVVNAVANVGASDINLGQNVQALRGTGGVELQQSLFNRADEKTVLQAQRGVDVARAALQAAEQDLIVRVASAYFDVLAATDTLATVRAGKRAISEQLASAKRNFEVGTATITDTREAQARFDLTTAQELAAENDLNVKRLALDSVVGQPNSQPRPLALPLRLPALAPANAEEWVNQGEAANPQLAQQRLAVEVARLETEKARAGQMPTVGWTASVTAGHLNSRSPSFLTGAMASSRDTGVDSTVGVRLTMPLYNGGLVQNRIRETNALELKAKSDLDNARRSLAQNTRGAFFGVQSLRAQAAALEAAEASSKLALEATQLGYKVGVRVNLDVLNAQTQLNQAQRDLAKARYDVLVNSLKLRQVTGLLQNTDLDAVDALLAR